MEKLQQLSRELLELNKKRDELNNKEDYDAAFETECDMRNISTDIAITILEMGAK